MLYFFPCLDDGNALHDTYYAYYDGAESKNGVWGKQRRRRHITMTDQAYGKKKKTTSSSLHCQIKRLSYALYVYVCMACVHMWGMGGTTKCAHIFFVSLHIWLNHKLSAICHIFQLVWLSKGDIKKQKLLSLLRYRHNTKMKLTTMWYYINTQQKSSIYFWQKSKVSTTKRHPRQRCEFHSHCAGIFLLLVVFNMLPTNFDSFILSVWLAAPFVDDIWWFCAISALRRWWSRR